MLITSELSLCHFADISTVNPAYAIDPEISDEEGYTIDLGLRGNTIIFSVLC